MQNVILYFWRERRPVAYFNLMETFTFASELWCFEKSWPHAWFDISKRQWILLNCSSIVYFGHLLDFFNLQFQIIPNSCDSLVCILNVHFTLNRTHKIVGKLFSEFAFIHSYFSCNFSLQFLFQTFILYSFQNHIFTFFYNLINEWILIIFMTYKTDFKIEELIVFQIKKTCETNIFDEICYFTRLNVV